MINDHDDTDGVLAIEGKASQHYFTNYNFPCCRSSDESADQLLKIVQLISQLQESSQHNKHPEKT